MTSITRWTPFRGWTHDEPFGGFLSLRNAMDRLFEDAFVRPGQLFGWSEGASGFGPLAVDLYETEDACMLTAALPGVHPQDVDVSVQGNVVTIRGESRAEEDATRGTCHLRERRYGSFYRQLQLPVPVDTEGAEARFENGILTLRLPKAEEARERKIQITSGSPSKEVKARAA